MTSPDKLKKGQAFQNGAPITAIQLILSRMVQMHAIRQVNILGVKKSYGANKNIRKMF